MIDVHPPHEPLHGWRDFFIHLFTITIGLFIALSLEGLVEWQHHRHLVHEAEASLHREIAANAASMSAALEDLHKQQSDLKHDVVLLKKIIQNPRMKLKDEHLEINFHIHTFDGVAWKTAQTTGALSYMPYDLAQQYGAIYGTQQELFDSEQVAARDAILSLAPFVNMSDNGPDLTATQADALEQKIEVLQGQLILVDALVQDLSQEYKKFLAAHPE